MLAKQVKASQLVWELRLQMGLTQEKFAARLGVTYLTVNRWENGRTKPSPMALKLIEEILKRMGDRGERLLKKYFIEQA
jgi:putative transcriptional regulator